jgi:branched-chain amino acid transport system substrate-binding protein
MAALRSGLAVAMCLVGAIVLNPVAALAQAATPGVTDTEIRIGIHLSLSGPASFVGQGSRVGAALALKEINDHGGVNGRKLVAIYVDDKGSPDGGVSAARRLVDEEKVFMVLGAGTSTSTVPVLPYFERNGVPYYVSLASDPAVTDKFRRNVYSGATASQASMTEGMADFVMSHFHPKRVAIMQCDQGHCMSGAPRVKGFLEKAGVTVTMTNFNSGDTDFTGQIQQIKAANPDVVFVYGLAADGPRIFPQLRRAGVQTQIVADTSLADPTVAHNAGKSAEGFCAFWFGGAQFIDDRTGAMGDWLKALEASGVDRPTNTPNLYSMMVYSDVYVVAEAMQKAGRDLTRDGFMKSLDADFHGFVAGKGADWTFAKPIGLPRTFSATDHAGNHVVQPVCSENGVFKPAA